MSSSCSSSVSDNCCWTASDDSSCGGCDGMANSGTVPDACGVCGGDSSTCTPAETGEQACEGQGFDEAACQQRGCCRWDNGDCWSDVNDWCGSPEPAPEPFVCEDKPPSVISAMGDGSIADCAAVVDAGYCLDIGNMGDVVDNCPESCGICNQPPPPPPPASENRCLITFDESACAADGECIWDWTYSALTSLYVEKPCNPLPGSVQTDSLCTAHEQCESGYCAAVELAADLIGRRRLQMPDAPPPPPPVEAKCAEAPTCGDLNLNPHPVVAENALAMMMALAGGGAFGVDENAFQVSSMAICVFAHPFPCGNDAMTCHF